MYFGNKTIIDSRDYTNPCKRKATIDDSKMPRLCNRWCRWQCATIFILSLILSFIFLSVISPLPSRPRLAITDLLPKKDRIGKRIRYLLPETFQRILD